VEGRLRLGDLKVNGKILMQKLWIREERAGLVGTENNKKGRRMRMVYDGKKDILQDQKQEGLEQDEHCWSLVGK